MYEALILEGVSWVVRFKDDSKKEFDKICQIPKYYEFDNGIAQVIAKVMNEDTKYEIDLNV